MILRLDKTFETSSAYPKSNWYENEPDNLVVDETTEEGQVLAAKIMQYAPYMELVMDGDKLVDVTPAERTVTLDEAKTQKLAELVTARDNEIFSTFQSSALGAPKTYNYNREAYENFRGKATMLSIDPTIASVDWATKEDGFVTHTRDQFIQVIKDGSVHEESKKMEYFQLEAQVENAYRNGDTDAILAVSW